MTAPDETAAASRGRKPRSPEAQLQRREGNSENPPASVHGLGAL